MTRLVLIDGSSYLYRAFHALPPLSNAQGEPTGALFGIVNMLRGHIKEKPEYIAFVVDASGPTFRDDLDPQYKANRPPMPGDLRAQIEPMMEIVAALGLPILRVPGVEADDVIGTLAVQGATQGLDVTISTSDKDFAQLVRPHLSLVNTMSGSRLDSDAAVIEKFGVRADQIVDFLALMGDSVDNIPGVDKCGPKTAAKWLAEYGTLENVIANADAIKGKIGENLREALPRLPLNRQLTTIKLDVALDGGPTTLALRERHVEDLRKLYARYGFNHALKELDGNGGNPGSSTGGERTSLRSTQAGYARSTVVAVEDSLDPALAEKGTYETIQTREQLDAWIVKLKAADEFAFDTETDALDAMQANLVGLSFSTEPGSGCYIPVGHTYPGAPAQLDLRETLEALRHLLESKQHRKLGQHGKYDIHVLRRHGVNVDGYTDDTMLESFIWNSSATRHDMDSLAKRYLGYDTIKFEDVAGKGAKQIPFSEVAIDDATGYAAEDADITLRLHRVLSTKLATIPALEQVYREIEIPLVPVLARMEANGILIDADELRRQSVDLSRRMLAAQQKATELAGRSFNLDSPKQLQALLFDELKLPALVKTPTGQPSTNEEALEAIADQHELPRIILDYRSLAKLRSTYTDKLPEMINHDTGRVHTSYHQAGAATGRLSSTDPNLQNIPIRTDDGRRIRKAFIAPKGRKLVACDYSQIELRIMAHLSQDPALIDAFLSDEDIHAATAANVFNVPPDEVTSEMRRRAKVFNFGVLYGLSEYGLSTKERIPREEAATFIRRYFGKYERVRAWRDGATESCRTLGYAETMMGRRRYIPEIKSQNFQIRSSGERMAINMPVQGTASDIIKVAMNRIDDEIAARGLKSRMILQVHDELIFEGPRAEIEIVREMALRVMPISLDLVVPLKIDIKTGTNWGELEVASGAIVAEDEYAFADAGA